MLASAAILSKRSFTNEFMMDIALEDTPVSGCTCFNTCNYSVINSFSAYINGILI